MAIPTRFNLGQTPAGRFLELIQPPMGAGARPAARIAETGGMGRMRGDVPMRLPQQRQQPRMPLQAAIMSGAGAMPTAGFVSPPPSAPPKTRPSINDRIGGMLPAAGTPQAAGLGAAGARMLQLSGYSDKPIAMSQILGEAAQAYRTEAKEERRAQAAAESAKQQRETDLRLKMMEIRATRGEAQDKRTQKDTDREIDMARQFKVDSKGFAGVKTNYRKLAAAATTKNPTGATDIGLIFSYMKMLDPTSVVRGSEYEAAAGASPLIQMLGQYYNQARKGTKLPEATRAQFYQAATEYYAGEVEGQQEREDAARQTAEKFGLDADKIVVSAVPVLGSEDYPHVIFDMNEQANIPAGDMFMINGVVYKKDAN